MQQMHRLHMHHLRILLNHHRRGSGLSICRLPPLVVAAHLHTVLQAMVTSRPVVWAVEHTASQVLGVPIVVVVEGFGVVLRLAVYLATCSARLHPVSVIISRTMTTAGARHHTGAHRRGLSAVAATAVVLPVALAPGLPRVLDPRSDGENDDDKCLSSLLLNGSMMIISAVLISTKVMHCNCTFHHKRMLFFVISLFVAKMCNLFFR